jgi:hypothetical protein
LRRSSQNTGARGLYQRAVGTEIALEHRDATVWRDRRAGRAHHCAGRRRRAAIGLRQRFAGCGEARAVDRTRFDERSDDHGGAADLVNVARRKAPAGAQIGDQRRAGEHRGDIVEVEGDAGLVRDRRA